MKGKEIRLKRLYKHSNRLLLVAMDHGVTLGPIPGIVNINQAIKDVFDGHADAVIVHKGILRDIEKILGPSSGEIIVHLSASTDLSPHSNRKDLVSSVEHAIRLGATGISVHVNLGSEFEPQMLTHLGMVAEECEQWGMPLLAMMYVRDGNKENEFHPKKIKHAARVAEELGADIVKLNYTGSPETFHEVTSAINIPIVIAGGPKIDSKYDLLAMIADAVEAGAHGVSIGRNVFQDENPTLLTSQIRKILDNNIRKDEINKLLANNDHM
jgi:predicted phospho-2-dehydro-3-deoxyheptonate aldolase